MTLIHTAMLSEAQYIIEKLKLNLVSKNPKIYCSDNIVLVVLGIGKENTIKGLNLIFKQYQISKAINIGIAGCSDKKIEIGDIFITNKKLEDINYMKLQTVYTPKLSPNPYLLTPNLYDMEAKYFQEISNKYITQNNIFIFKVVSDHFQPHKITKDKTKSLIFNVIDDINYIISQKV